jgi:hypothetical protein
MTNKDLIFSSKDVDVKILKKLGLNPTDKTLNLTIHERRVKDLFEGKVTALTMTDIVLGYYNKYTKNNNSEKLINRNYMGLIVYRMTQKKILKSCSKGVYALN